MMEIYLRDCGRVFTFNQKDIGFELTDEDGNVLRPSDLSKEDLEYIKKYQAVWKKYKKELYGEEKVK